MLSISGDYWTDGYGNGELVVGGGPRSGGNGSGSPPGGGIGGYSWGGGSSSAPPDSDGDGIPDSEETNPEPEIVVNGITAELDLRLKEDAKTIAWQVVFMGTILTGGLALESALFARLAGVVGEEFARRIALGGAALGDLALSSAIESVVYDGLLASAVDDYEDDGRINYSNIQDWNAYKGFIVEYNQYIDSMNDNGPEPRDPREPDYR